MLKYTFFDHQDVFNMLSAYLHKYVTEIVIKWVINRIFIENHKLKSALINFNIVF